MVSEGGPEHPYDAPMLNMGIHAVILARADGRIGCIALTATEDHREVVG